MHNSNINFFIRHGSEYIYLFLSVIYPTPKMNPTSPFTPEQLRKYIVTFWKVVGYGFGGFILLIVLINLGLFGALPSFRELENPQSNLASEVISSDKNILGTYFVENRSNCNYEDLSPNLINALIATEDTRFYSHSGIDFRRTITIVFYNLIGKKQGGSTITQQLAKNLYPRKKQFFLFTIITKLKEWITAVKLERNYTKEEILTNYFNTVDFGSSSYGIKIASKTYFNTTPDKITINQAALLIGLLKGSSFYSPKRHPERALARRNTVLNQMEKYGVLRETQCDSLKAEPIKLNYTNPDHNEGLATYFREYIRLELGKWCEENKKADGEKYDLYRDGLKIYTTIDSRMQKYAEESVKEHLTGLQADFFKHWKDKEPWGEFTEIIDNAVKRSERYAAMKEAGQSKAEIERFFRTEKLPMKLFGWKGDIDTTLTPLDSIKYYKKFLRSSFMSMDPLTGHVKAWVGGPDYQYFKYDQVKEGKRQVGSTFKPFVYAVAMDNGFSPCFEAPNLPVVFEEYDNWSPSNSDGAQGGSMTLRRGLANSVNLITAYIMKQIGPRSVVNLAKRMGITSEIPAVPSICLGTCDVSLYDMVGAYSTFANKGVWTEPTYITRIEDKNGNVLYEKVPKRKDAISEQTAYLMLYMMRGVVDGGTGSRLRGPRYRIPYPIAGKTGTTQNNSDGWFIGITPDLVSGVWTGAEDRAVHFRSTNLGEGANSALPVWGLYMNKIYADTTIKISRRDFTQPKGGLKTVIDCAKYKIDKQQSTETDASGLELGG